MKLAIAVALFVVPPVAAQAGLTQAAAQAKAAWIAHQPQRLLEGSPGVILQIPGADPSSAIGRALSRIAALTRVCPAHISFRLAELGQVTTGAIIKDSLFALTIARFSID